MCYAVFEFQKADCYNASSCCDNTEKGNDVWWINLERKLICINYKLLNMKKHSLSQLAYFMLLKLKTTFLNVEL